MLILSRKVGEKIVIGDGITVVINRVAGDRVTIGLEAPPEVRILRGELRPFDNPRRETRHEPVAAGDRVGPSNERMERHFRRSAPAHPR
ncbi:MAG: carbon storage regulator [Pirellulales bacterium]|nr:carbon storage regulator [Pirellulales bacterium]